MRSIFAFILGVLVTVGGAYIHDNYAASPAGSTDPVAKPMVNWDVVTDSARVAADRAREQWDKLTAAK
ncbi:MAG TPA: hypothetical protein VHA77_11815 [Xanthobacteraceae bacterium]|jgi:hypothetical protein|nr:hypothetical protein [Xanthobacteraceae bacterium]